MFAYDHLFRRDRAGRRRPALEMFALMGAVASATERIAVGSLVARATLRPYATLANGFDTLARILGPERLLVAIGAGDQESREENETYGLDFGTVTERVTALRDAVDETRDRGYPVWVGGSDPAVREVAAAHADGWNRWGAGLERFRTQAANLRAAAARAPFTVTWGGLVIIGDDDRAAEIKAARGGRPRARRRPRDDGHRAPRLRRRRRRMAHARARRLLGSRQRANPGEGDTAPVALTATKASRG